MLIYVFSFVTSDMNLWDEYEKVLRSIGNIVASDNSKCDAVLTAGQSLPGKPFRKVVKLLKTGSELSNSLLLDFLF